ncbi:unnamed protein product [Schistosoma curassoni]|nr:unnamed protein product [Schistosoma curassoni]
MEFIISVFSQCKLIRRNQPSPIVGENFEKLVTDKKIDMKFPFTFYGTAVSAFSVGVDGKIEIEVQGAYALINNYIFGDLQCETEISDKKEYFAVRRSCPTNIDNKIDTIKVMHLIHSNGKISFYYENIPRGLKKGDVESGIGYDIRCGEGNNCYLHSNLH